MRLIVGLGNPGVKYANTRHNAGFMALDLLAHREDFEFRVMKFHSMYAEWVFRGEKVALLKPMTFMNLSGQAVGEAIRFYRLPLDELLVIADDIDIEPGMIRIRPSGGTGTHNGLRSIRTCLGTDDYPKMKLGMGKYTRQGDLADFVLKPPAPEDDSAIDDMLERSGQAIQDYLRYGLEYAMNHYNGHAVKHL